jgi:hypothetical protein
MTALPKNVKTIGILECKRAHAITCNRILEILRKGEPRTSWDADRHRWALQGEWFHRPGAMPWWAVRQRLGGRVRARAFRFCVDTLLSEGQLIEVWLDAPTRHVPPHSLLLPGHSEALSYPVARAAGREDVLAREPWYAGLVEYSR